MKDSKDLAKIALDVMFDISEMEYRFDCCASILNALRTSLEAEENNPKEYAPAAFACWDYLSSLKEELSKSVDRYYKVLKESKEDNTDTSAVS